MSFHNKLIEKTKQSIAELQDAKPVKVSKICEHHFDLFENELFPMLNSLGMSRYGFLVDMLRNLGYESVTENKLAVCFGRLRAKRAGTSIKGVQSAWVAPTPSVDPVVMTKSVDMTREVAIPSTGAIATKLVSHGVQPNQVDSNSHVYADTCSVAPSDDYEDINDVIKRLKSEKDAGWNCEWHKHDEYFWEEILKAGALVSMISGKQWSIHGSPVAIKKEINGELRKEIFDLLIKKVVKCRK